MDLFAMLLMIVGLVLFPIGLIWVIVSAIKRRKKKPAFIAIVLSVILFIVGSLIMPSDDYSDPEGISDGANSVNNANDYSDTEIFASKFCMAYMNSLKNPYSFKVKYIWANDVGDGKYEVYVKFTAE